ncbi:MAG TPA: cytochrome c oxidase subunit II [Pirellulales bacterium]|nr:cytochrome c oxidase subunit II [Pirellulales bacterium]
MGKFWSILFVLIPVLGTGLFVVAADPDNRPLLNHWFPEDVSEYGYVIDGLFMVILWLTGIVFIATELTLAWFLWRYDAKSNRDPVKYMHGSHNLEVVWTILPAATLLFLAIYQLNAWAETKVRVPSDAGLTVEVTARQFEWRLRYPGEDGKFDTPDDLYTVNDLHIPVDEDIVVQLKSADVLHSFFLPNLRVKQDAVPGMKIPVWFRAKRTGTFDLVCAELCGWGHYKMKGRLTVQSPEDFKVWLSKLRSEQNKTNVSEDSDEHDG